MPTLFFSQVSEQFCMIFKHCGIYRRKILVWPNICTILCPVCFGLKDDIIAGKCNYKCRKSYANESE